MGAHHGVVNAVRANHAAQRNHAVGHALGKVQHVGHHAVKVSAKVAAQPAKAGDHLVKNQQNAVLVANLAQPLDVALRRHIPACAARYWLNDDGGNVAGVMQRQNAVFKFGQQVFCPYRLFAMDVGVTRMFRVQRVMDKPHVVHPRQQRRAVNLAVGRYAAHTHAAKAHAVIAALATNEHIAVALAACPVVSQRHLERCVGRLAAGVAKQHLVQVARRHGGNHVGGDKGLVIAGLKGGGVVERVELLFDGLVDRLSVMPCGHTPQAGNSIDHLLAVMGGKHHAVGSDKHARVFGKAAVGGKGQPVVVHMKDVVGHRTLLQVKAAQRRVT